jgi:chemotaxis protein methyltransferase CheR
VQRTKANSDNTNFALSAPLFAYFAVGPGKVGETLILQGPVMFSEESIPLTDQQVHEVLVDVLALHGYDFTNYSPASIRRRIARLIVNDRFESFDAFHSRLRNDKEYFRRFLEQITVSATEMFRDASFYRTLREKVLPLLGPPPIRIWHAGCSTGEEVYSMAIILEELGLLNNTELYATDINPAVLGSVKEGAYPLTNMKQYSDNYLQSGGASTLRNYYNIEGDVARFNPALSRNMIVSRHNLVSDAPFRKWHLIMCRNVLIYFDRSLQERVLKIFLESLEPGGFLALGSKETIRFSGVEKDFRVIARDEKIWRKASIINSKSQPPTASQV